MSRKVLLPEFTILTTENDNNNYHKNNIYYVSLKEHFSNNNQVSKIPVNYFRSNWSRSGYYSRPPLPIKYPLDSFPINIPNNYDLTIHDQIMEYLSYPNSYSSSEDLIKSKDILSHKLSSSNCINFTKIPLIFNFTLSHSHSYSYSELLVQTENYNKSLSFNDNTDINPTSLRYYSSRNNIYIERPPFKATVHFKPSRASSPGKEIESYEIWVPWTITEINFTENNSISQHNARLFFSPSSLSDTSLNQYVTCMFPNTYNDGRICFSNSLSSIPNFDSQSIRYIYSMMINEYISGGWNLDLGIPVLNHANSSNYRYNPSLKNPSPLIVKEYFEPTYDSLISRFPKLSKNSANSLIKYSSSSSHSSHSKYFFKMMSGMTLEETLNFYSFFCNQSFEDIVNSHSSYYHPYAAERLSDLIHARALHHYVSPVYTTASSVNKTISFIIFNSYNGNDINSLITHLNTNRITDNFSNSENIFTSFKDIITKELSKILNNNNSYCYIYFDAITNQYELHFSSDENIDQIIKNDIFCNIISSENLQEVSL